jgi:hypothetical protein
MGGSVERKTSEVAEEIRRYCVQHPRACDTIDGIAWWVQMQLQKEIRSSVADAVQILVKEGKLEKHLLRDGSEVFGCAVAAGKTGDA